MASSHTENSTLNIVGVPQRKWEAEVMRKGARLVVMGWESALEHEV